MDLAFEPADALDWDRARLAVVSSSEETGAEGRGRDLTLDRAEALDLARGLLVLDVETELNNQHGLLVGSR